MLKKIILFVYVSAFWINVSAQQTDNNDIEPDETQDSDTSVSAVTFFKPKGMRTTLYLGRFESADEPQFEGIRAEYSLGIGLSAELDQYPYLALDLELFDFNREFDTTVPPPLFGTVDNDTAAQTFALLFGVRAFYPTDSSFRVYASAGLGFFKTELVVSGSTFGLPGSMKESSSSLDIYYGAGVSYMFNQWGLGLDYRHFDLDGSFSSFNIDNADLGGDALLIGLRYSF